MNKELLFNIGATLALAYLTESAFSRNVRKEVGYRDHWTCQADGDGIMGRCLTAELEGLDHPVSYMEGYWITAAHYNSGVQYKSHPQHDNPTSGRCLCDLDHAAEELARGNENGARLMLGMGVYNQKEAEKRGGQLVLTIDELKDLINERS